MHPSPSRPHVLLHAWPAGSGTSETFLRLVRASSGAAALRAAWSDLYGDVASDGRHSIKTLWYAAPHADALAVTLQLSMKALGAVEVAPDLFRVRATHKGVAVPDVAFGLLGAALTNALLAAEEQSVADAVAASVVAHDTPTAALAQHGLLYERRSADAATPPALAPATPAVSDAADAPAADATLLSDLSDAPADAAPAPTAADAPPAPNHLGLHDLLEGPTAAAAAAAAPPAASYLDVLAAMVPAASTPARGAAVSPLAPPPSYADVLAAMHTARASARSDLLVLHAAAPGAAALDVLPPAIVAPLLRAAVHVFGDALRAAAPDFGEEGVAWRLDAYGNLHLLAGGPQVALSVGALRAVLQRLGATQEDVDAALRPAFGIPLYPGLDGAEARHRGVAFAAAPTDCGGSNGNNGIGSGFDLAPFGDAAATPHAVTLALPRSTRARALSTPSERDAAAAAATNSDAPAPLRLLHNRCTGGTVLRHGAAPAEPLAEAATLLEERAATAAAAAAVVRGFDQLTAVMDGVRADGGAPLLRRLFAAVGDVVGPEEKAAAAAAVAAGAVAAAAAALQFQSPPACDCAFCRTGRVDQESLTAHAVAALRLKGDGAWSGASALTGAILRYLHACKAQGYAFSINSNAVGTHLAALTGDKKRGANGYMYPAALPTDAQLDAVVAGLRGIRRPAAE